MSATRNDYFISWKKEFRVTNIRCSIQRIIFRRESKVCNSVKRLIISERERERDAQKEVIFGSMRSTRLIGWWEFSSGPYFQVYFEAIRLTFEFWKILNRGRIIIERLIVKGRGKKKKEKEFRNWRRWKLCGSPYPRRQASPSFLLKEDRN